MLAQIKHSINITKNDGEFGKFIHAAWKDFNNNKVFCKKRDVIGLITGLLSKTDVNDTRTILEWARYAGSAEEFIEKVNLPKFSSNKKRDKLETFRTHLNRANDGEDVSPEELFDFLRQFYLLGYDLDIKGTTLSLLHSLIGQYSQYNAQGLWSQIVDEVHYANKNAGTITRESFPPDLQDVFKPRYENTIPKKYLPDQPSSDWNHRKHAQALAMANLLGAWSENNAAYEDIEIIKDLTSDYSKFIEDLREILQLSDSPISLRDDKWSIKDRKSLWDALGSRLFNETLDTFKRCAVTVLTDRDTKFELPSDQRFAAALYNKGLKYSPNLRKGMAESLALLGSRSEVLTYCSPDKTEGIAAHTIFKIFDTADWVVLGSLNDLLPTLAEAAPKAFLQAVDNALQQSPSPFDEIFSQEGSTLFGRNYLTGLLWALEGLAWDAEYLVRVCVIFGKLASHDPGGNWANRPANSLTTIFLPWFPQTIAPIEKREVAVETLRNGYPDIAFEMLVSLLPNPNQISFGSYKPLWRDTIPADWKNGVTNREYWEQVSLYADIAISIAGSDAIKLGKLIDHFFDLPQPSLEKLIEVLSSDLISELPEDKKLYLWDKLEKVILPRRRFSDEKEATPQKDRLTSIEAIAKNLETTRPVHRYRHLFDYSAELYEEAGNWEEKQKRLDERRQKAMSEILEADGIESVIQFAKSVKLPDQVGNALGHIAGIEVDSFLLPAYLGLEDSTVSHLMNWYVLSRHFDNGWSWAKELDKSDWSRGQIGEFLGYLPFTNETWNYVAECLGDEQGDYWLKTGVFPSARDNDLSIAVDKLIEHNRFSEATNCLFRMCEAGQPIDIEQSVKALLLVVLTSPNSYNPSAVSYLIDALQENPDVKRDDLIRIEWVYLPFMGIGTYLKSSGITPITLENTLADEPEFFCEVIRSRYRSKNADVTAKERSTEDEAFALNAFRLLRMWRTPPGMQKDGSFDASHFSNWLERVKEICTESGHLVNALEHAGEVLVHTPPDKDGWWIDRTVAGALNAEDAEKLRLGFYIGEHKLRGAFMVDPTGKPEFELAEQYLQKAKDVEDAGYHRFAEIFRSISEDYKRDARRNIKEAKEEEEEYKKYKEDKEET